MHNRSYAVLVVEDNALIGFDLSDVIEAAGYSVIGPFVKPSDALTILQTSAADAAIIDVQLQQDDNQTLACELRRRSIPFAVHTGVPQHDPANDPFGGALRLAKPASHEDLIAMVHRLCNAPSGAGAPAPART